MLCLTFNKSISFRQSCLALWSIISKIWQQKKTRSDTSAYNQDINRSWLLHFCTLNFCKLPRGYHFSRNYKIENKKLLWCRKRTCAEICVIMKSLCHKALWSNCKQCSQANQEFSCIRNINCWFARCSNMRASMVENVHGSNRLLTEPWATTKQLQASRTKVQVAQRAMLLDFEYFLWALWLQGIVV